MSEHNADRNDTPSQGTWRRSLRRLHRVHGLPGNNKELSLTTSRGSAYLIDQFMDRVPTAIKNRVVAMLSEFVGTFLFMFIGIGGTSAVSNDAASQMQWAHGNLLASPSKLLFIAVSWSMAIIINAWIFFRVSGGLFNPAVTLALMVVRGVDIISGLLDIASQIGGAICASAIIYALTPPGSLAPTILGEHTSVTQGLFIEMILTAQLVLAVFMLATEKHKATFIAPVGIGLTVFADVLAGAAYTGASLNPARSFGVCVITADFRSYHWIYWVGPALGSLLATGFYLLIRKLEYWTVNGDVDEYESKVGRNVELVKERI